MNAGAAPRPRRWLRRFGHAAIVAGLVGIAAVLLLFAIELVTGPPVSAGAALRLFAAIMPAALFGPICLTLPLVALGLLIERSWRGPPPLALWALAGAIAGAAASLMLGRGAPVHLAAAAVGATALVLFGYLGREEERARG